MFGDLEIYTTSSAVLALLYSHYASIIENNLKPTGPEINKKRLAIIWNSIGITINIAVFLIYFVFIPITKLSDNTFNFEYFFKLKSIAIFLSMCVTLFHFFISKFVMLETDCRYVVMILSFWALVNLTVEFSNGLFFSELKGSKNIIKVSLSVFLISATSVMYLVLCQLSQMIKKVNEKDQRNEVINLYRKKGGLVDDSDGEEDSFTEGNQNE